MYVCMYVCMYVRMYVCAYSIFCPLCSCSLLFSTAPHFHLAGRSFLTTSISHCLTAGLDFHVFLPTKFVSFVFNHSLWLFLCYPREHKDKIQRRKRHDFVGFSFFLKVPAAMRFRCISVAIPVD